MPIKNKKRVPKQFQRVLWSYDVNKMDLEEDKKEIITQVLNYGTWEDLKLLYRLYPEREIKEIVKNPRRGVWFKKVLNFWTTIFNIKLKREVWEKAIFR
jgi:hypothetical protein